MNLSETMCLWLLKSCLNGIYCTECVLSVDNVYFRQFFSEFSLFEFTLYLVIFEIYFLFNSLCGKLSKSFS